MEQTELAALGKYVMREQQHLGCLRVREGVITLEKMFCHDEIRPAGEIAPRKTKVATAELELAPTLIEQFKGAFEPERYEDTYREALAKILKAKQKGDSIKAAAEEEEEDEERADLLTALKASVEAAKHSKGGAGRGSRRRASARRVRRRSARAAAN